MILTCPSCGTRYAVPTDSIGRGREVRCAKCAHRWYQAGETPSSPEIREPLPSSSAEVHPIPPGSGLPAPFAKRPTPRRLILGTAMIWVLAFLTAFLVFQPWVMAHAPVTTFFYDALGFHDTTGLAMSDVRVVRTGAENGREQFTVTGNLVNRSEAERRVATLRISLWDTQGKLYRYWDFKQGDRRIQPGESLPFTADNLESRSRKIGNVTVELGNPLQLYFR